MIIDNMSPTAWLQVGACVPHGTVIKMQVNPSVILHYPKKKIMGWITKSLRQKAPRPVEPGHVMEWRKQCACKETVFCSRVLLRCTATDKNQMQPFWIELECVQCCLNSFE